MQKKLKKNLNSEIRQEPLIGAGSHDFNEATNIRFDQPLIGGDHDYNWATF